MGIQIYEALRLLTKDSRLRVKTRSSLNNSTGEQMAVVVMIISIFTSTRIRARKSKRTPIAIDAL